MPTPRNFPIYLLATMVILSGCGGLPGDFALLPLEEQVEAYEENFREHGGALLEARAHISWHGWEAADLMADYISGRRTGLPDREVISIIQEVQWRGCSLKGSRAECALEEFLKRTPPHSVEAIAAESALEAIQKNIVVPGGPDVLKGGPCEGLSVPLE